MTLGQRAFDRFTAGRQERYDVVFYAPWIGRSLLAQSLPAGGAETQILLLAKALVRLGLRVAILAFGEPGQLPDELEGVAIHVRVPAVRGRGLVGRLVETARIWGSLWRVPASSVVHRGASIDLGLIGLFARLTRRRLVFASANVSDFDHGKIEPNPLYRRLYHLGVRLAHTIVVQSEEQVQLCQEAFGRHPTLIKSIAALTEAQPAHPEAFLWAGRLVSYKRPLEYIALARALPEAKFWLVGVPIPHLEGDERVAAAVAAEAQEVSNLELLPPRRHEELQALMASAVASVNTADFEGMPNVLLEAWSLGVPALVLSHDPDGVVARYGLGGYADGSMEKLVESARVLWDTRERRAEISQRCRDYIRRHHAPAVIAEQWLSVLGRLSRPGSRS